MSSRTSTIGGQAEDMMKSMTGREALDLLDRARKRLLPGLVKRVTQDPEMSILIGDTDDNIGPVSFTVGIREFIESPDRAFAIEKAITPVVNLYHEACGYGGQILREFNKTTPLASVLALSHYGCKTSEEYYGIKNGQITKRYCKQPKEIAAQYVGIKVAYRFLSDEYDSEEADGLLCRYVRDRIRKCSDSLDYGPLCISVSTILKSMDKMFAKCAFRQRTYDPKNRAYDDLQTYAKRVDRPELGRMVKSCKDGIRQDLMMASVWIAS